MENKKIFTYKLDFYYKSLIIYLIFLIVYALFRGNFSKENFSVVFQDPIIYLTFLFIVITLITLIINATRAKRIIFENDKIIFQNRFGKREINLNEILNIKFSRERGKRVDGARKIRLIKIKLKDRKKLLKLRIGEYQNERALIHEFKKIKS